MTAKCRNYKRWTRRPNAGPAGPAESRSPLCRQEWRHGTQECVRHVGAVRPLSLQNVETTNVDLEAQRHVGQEARATSQAARPFVVARRRSCSERNESPLKRAEEQLREGWSTGPKRTGLKETKPRERGSTALSGQHCGLAARGGSPRTRKKGTASRFPQPTAIENEQVPRAEIGGSPPFSPEHTSATGC